MNKLIMIFIMLFTGKVFADCSETVSTEETVGTKVYTTDVPSHLKGAKICIFKESTGYQCVPAEKFKVVPRVQQEVVTHTKQTNSLMCVVKADKEKNRLSIMAGNGPKEGLERSKTASKVTVESRVGTVGGVQYQRLLTDRISAGVQVQSNESALVNIGLDF